MEDDRDWTGSPDPGDEEIEGDNLLGSEDLSQFLESLDEESGSGAQPQVVNGEAIGEAPLTQEPVPAHSLNQQEELLTKTIPIPTGEERHDKAPDSDNVGEALTNQNAIESDCQIVHNFVVNRVPLSVAMNVGTLNMSIKKLDELRVGDTIELNGGEAGGVTLVANGCEIGVGTLVSVNEQLAVQIISIGM